ncbi:MAG: hypothetical protein RLZZ54_1223 [Cyanobacteriota bacterium]|jgi:hypothetical protein
MSVFLRFAYFFAIFSVASNYLFLHLGQSTLVLKRTLSENKKSSHVMLSGKHIFAYGWSYPSYYAVLNAKPIDYSLNICTALQLFNGSPACLLEKMFSNPPKLVVTHSQAGPHGYLKENFGEFLQQNSFLLGDMYSIKQKGVDPSQFDQPYDRLSIPPMDIWKLKSDYKRRQPYSSERVSFRPYSVDLKPRDVTRSITRAMTSASIPRQSQPSIPILFDLVAFGGPSSSVSVGVGCTKNSGLGIVNLGSRQLEESYDSAKVIRYNIDFSDYRKVVYSCKSKDILLSVRGLDHNPVSAYIRVLASASPTHYTNR